MTIQWEDSELRQLAADLGAAGNKITKRVAETVRDSGNELKRTAEQLSPVRTGALRGGWEVEISGTSATLRNNTRQAFFQEFGTSKMAAQPSAGPALEAVTPRLMEGVEKVGSEIL